MEDYHGSSESNFAASKARRKRSTTLDQSFLKGEEEVEEKRRSEQGLPENERGTEILVPE
jgi:hypothetical protein